jgi:hypothetical protein
MTDCQKCLCDKNIHSLTDWRNELMRIRKHNVKTFEDHPEFKKLTQCKDEIVDKKTCDVLFKKSTAPKAKPKTSKAKPYAPTSPPRARTPPPKRKTQTDKYNEYLEKLKQYELKKKKLADLKSEMQRMKTEISAYKKEVESDKAEVEKLNKKLDGLLDKYVMLNRKHSATEEVQLGQKIKELEALMAKKFNNLLKVEIAIKVREEKMVELLDLIENAAIELENETKPVPPSGNTRDSFAFDERKRCPKTYRRNKTTKKCEKKV